MTPRPSPMTEPREIPTVNTTASSDLSTQTGQYDASVPEHTGGAGSPSSRRPRLRAFAQFDGWRSFMVAVCLDWGVMRCGDNGVERSVDLDVSLGLWSFGVSCYWVLEPRRPSEHFLDTMLRYEDKNSEEHP